MKAESLACLKKYSGARENFKIALNRNPHAVDSIKAWESEILLWQGRYKEALKTIDGVLNTCPPFVYSWRAIANHKLGNRKSALDDLKKALSFNPCDVEALVYRGEIARLDKDYNLAERLIKKSLGINGFNFWAYANLALIKLEQGKDEEFLKNFNKAKTWMKDPAAVTLSAAENQRDGADIKKAGKTLSKWFSLSKGNRRWELPCFGSWLIP